MIQICESLLQIPLTDGALSIQLLREGPHNILIALLITAYAFDVPDPVTRPRPRYQKVQQNQAGTEQILGEEILLL